MTEQHNHLLAVLGAGVMGTGIAALALGHGVPVVLVDVDEEILARATRDVRQRIRQGQLLGKLPRVEQHPELLATTDLGAVAPATAVVEAVVELPEVKADVLTKASGLVKPGTPVITNTSGIPVDELAGHCARPEDVVGAHFMNPPYLIRTVEVIRGPRSTDGALGRTLELLTALDRESVVVGDGPGFVINRILQRMINESARIVQEGIAGHEEVDALFRGCLGHTTGPLATADLIGLDNVVDSLRVLHERTGDAGYDPCDLLLSKVAAGHHGRKTGRGFYEYGP
ncbi:3-hydroxyacyl-CoA dehydrogenase family protein [Streptomyces sp. XD-27]|uniref:3-hydroxyacyl-CoA dehydrogenase family protein n=1 Tax=Streptomyces sp. XD-27 TaxID=3062779 RepID=UPI0026F466A2|nr:3-hydroxyacyl-CoA dehydrogenase family protein [Streptomyces sp. XD-27]WKX73994.1 3-hydroxyacyl-CoA dehydrogenase family protein [Streptomyces sp. XD-27]